MDIFLGFKNKDYKLKYHQEIDPFLDKVITSNLVVTIAGLPFDAAVQYFRFRDLATPILVRRILLSTFTFVFLLAMVFVVKRLRARLRRYVITTTWLIDIFYVILAAYLSYTQWDFMRYEEQPEANYYWGWWSSLVAVALMNPISRWYLKITAFLIFILQMGIASYLSTRDEAILVNIFQLVLLQALLVYLTEKDNRRYFIEKQSLYDETKVFRKIFDETADGVIVYGIKEGVLYKNWSNQKHHWWMSEFNVEENLKNIALEGFKKASHHLAKLNLDLTSLTETSNYPNLWAFLNQLECLMSEALTLPQNSKSLLQSRKLLVVTGHTEQTTQSGSTHNLLLEIKIMATIFREKPSLVLIFSDITERNLVAILQENNDYKNRLLASVSHELRTPLNASINFTQIAIESPGLSSEIRDNYLLPALRSNQLLLHLINDILDFSQMSANKLRLVYETCDVTKTLEECLNLVRIQAQRKGILLTADYEFEGGSSEFCTDHNRLRQIVLNLLSNALKFTLQGEIKLTAKSFTLPGAIEFPFEREAEESKEDETRTKYSNATASLFKREREDSPFRSMARRSRVLSIEVSDTGIGISPENQKKLFKTFEKIELGNKRSLNSQGAGLGLVISNNLVQMLGPPGQHNGMKLKSDVDQGSTFSFCILDQHHPSQEDLESSPVHQESYNLINTEEGSPNTQQVDTLANMFPKESINTIISAREFPYSARDQRQVSRSEAILKKMKLQKPRILVVDDDIFNISAIELILSKLGHSCDKAYNGAEAIEKIVRRQSEAGVEKQEYYEMVFMDCNMPIMDGYQAASILKKKIRESELQEFTVIACTAFLNEKEKQRICEIGFDDYCFKPISKEKIEKILKKFLPLRPK